MTSHADFLSSRRFADVRASRDRAKYGNKVLRCYLQDDREVVAVNPGESAIEGVRCVSSLVELEGNDWGVSVITPPGVTLQVLEDAASMGIQRLWLQPGSESEEVLDRLRQLGLDAIHSGPCLLVVLGFTES